MIRLDEDAVICDLAETYGVLNYRELPLQTVATLASGLHADARIMEAIRTLKKHEDNPSFQTTNEFDEWRKTMLGGD